MFPNKITFHQCYTTFWHAACLNIAFSARSFNILCRDTIKKHATCIQFRDFPKKVKQNVRIILEDVIDFLLLIFINKDLMGKYGLPI